MAELKKNEGKRQMKYCMHWLMHLVSKWTEELRELTEHKATTTANEECSFLAYTSPLKWINLAEWT